MPTRLTPFVLAFLSVVPAARADVPRVVTDIGPVHSLVAQVMAGVGAPEQILPSGTSPHDFALRPSQARALAEAEIVVWIGPSLSPALARGVDVLSKAADVVTLSDMPGTAHLPFREDFALDGGADGHAHDDPEGGHDHGHDHGADDPHLWLMPSNARGWLSGLANALAEADPDNAKAYRANAADGIAAIEAAETAARASLTGVADQPLVVAHDAFQYFENAFGLRVIGAITNTDAVPPSPARLDGLRNRIAAEAPRCFLAEPQTDPGLVAAASDGMQIPVAILDPLGSDLPAGAGLYPALITGLADAIAACGQA